MQSHVSQISLFVFTTQLTHYQFVLRTIFCILFCYTLDIIGVLQDVVKTQMGCGGKKLCANITLRDEAWNVIEVALLSDPFVCNIHCILLNWITAHLFPLTFKTNQL